MRGIGREESLDELLGRQSRVPRLVERADQLDLRGILGRGSCIHARRLFAPRIPADQAEAILKGRATAGEVFKQRIDVSSGVGLNGMPENLDVLLRHPARSISRRSCL